MKAETPADSPTTSLRSWSNSEAGGLSRCRTGFFGGLNQIGREMVLGPGSPWGPRLTAATASPPRSQAAEGLHCHTGPAGGNHGGLLAHALGEQLDHRGDADQAEGDGPGEPGTVQGWAGEGGAEGWGGAGLTTAPTCPPGEVSPVLAGRALRPLPVLRGGSYGGIQHASVHPAGVQGHGRPGKYRDRPSRQLTVPLLDWRGLSWLGSGSKGPGVGWKRSAWASWTVTPTTE